MKFRRRRYIVDAELQLKLSLVFALSALTAGIAAAAAFNYFSLKKIEAVMWSTHIAVKDTGEVLGPVFLYTNIINFVFVFSMLIVTALWMMKKTSGPVGRMSRDMGRVADGDLSTEIALRQKDAFQDTAEELNNMVKHIRGWFINYRSRCRDISQLIAKLEKEVSSSGNTGKICDSILDKIDSLEEDMSTVRYSRLE